MSEKLQLVVRTPHQVVAELSVESLRVPVDSGQVGLRPRCEPALFALEPGLALVRAGGRLRFLATGGGLLRCDGRRAVLLTPVAVLGDDAGSVRAQLEEALVLPEADGELRKAIERLQAGILRELRGDSKGLRPGTGR